MADLERHAIAVLVENEPGVLARVIGLFSGRGYNIESLTVAEVDRQNRLSRITIVTSGTRMIIEQIKAQLSRLVPVHRVHDLTDEGPFVEREMMLIKIAGKGETRIESLRLADIFRARVVELDDRKLCLRDHRVEREIERLHYADGAAWARRGVAHRCGGDLTRPGELLAPFGSGLSLTAGEKPSFTSEAPLLSCISMSYSRIFRTRGSGISSCKTGGGLAAEFWRHHLLHVYLPLIGLIKILV